LGLSPKIEHRIPRSIYRPIDHKLITQEGWVVVEVGARWM
jgi:hypothetical protein